MHPLVLALFDDPSSAANAARGLRSVGLARERVSVVARSHDEEGQLADAAGASPGSEIEDSRPASRLGELSAHLLAAIALVLPGVGSIVVDGPLAAGLGEAAGHVAGGIARALHQAGLERAEADRWQQRIEEGAFLIGAHVEPAMAPTARDIFVRNGAASLAEATWSD